MKSDVNGVKAGGVGPEEVFVQQKGKSGEWSIIGMVVIFEQAVSSREGVESSFETEGLAVKLDDIVIVRDKTVLKGVGVANERDKTEKDEGTPGAEEDSIFLRDFSGHFQLHLRDEKPSI